jgi:hypothetical protein
VALIFRHIRSLSHGMMDIVHDDTIGTILEHTIHEVADTEDWKRDDGDLYYLPVLATQHEIPLPIDFKRQRYCLFCRRILNSIMFPFYSVEYNDDFFKG